MLAEVYGQESNKTGCKNIPDSNAIAKSNCLNQNRTEIQSPPPSTSMNKLQCIIREGYYYEIDGVGHCLVIK